MQVPLCFCLLLLWGIAANVEASSPSFIIDTSEGIFRKDGQPFQYASGSFHYFRIPRMYWADRLAKYKAAGLDAIQIYVPWNMHEPRPNEFQFAGDRNLTALFELVKQHDLLLIARPGPYICAEVEFGGLPAWLWGKNPKMKLRSSDLDYSQYAMRWWSTLLPLMRPYLFENGGPIIMLQIENEYGSYPTCDKAYMQSLVETARTHLGNNLIHFTTDGNSMGLVKCGRIPKHLEADNNMYTVDFGKINDAKQAFLALNSSQPNKPLINSELYFGWLTHWGEKQTIMDEGDIRTMQLIYSYSKRASFNIYMFHGGSNFHLSNGANAWPYSPQITSYDYGAPLSENGDLTLNYMEVRDAIHKMKGIPVPPISVKNVTTKRYPNVTLNKEGNLLQSLTLDMKYPHVRSMEDLAIFEQGFVAYSTKLKKVETPDIKEILFTYGRDNLQIFSSKLDLTKIRYLGEIGPNVAPVKNQSLKLDADSEILHIVVENQGHINYGYGMQGDIKGLLGSVKVSGEELTDWSIEALDLNSDILPQLILENEVTLCRFFGKLSILDLPVDTFIRVNAKAKGVIVINDQILGRFNMQLGPQRTLYVPASYWQLGDNKIRVILSGSFEDMKNKLAVEFYKQPIWN